MIDCVLPPFYSKQGQSSERVNPGKLSLDYCSGSALWLAINTDPDTYETVGAIAFKITNLELEATTECVPNNRLRLT